MRHIVSYSGGVGSAITAKLVCDIFGKENVTLLFADTLIEDPSLYKFNEQLTNKLQCEFITISDGRTPWQVFEDVKYLGNTRVDPCSRILKRDLIKKWLQETYKPAECIVYIGIDCSEEHRLTIAIERNKPYVYKSILVENDIFLNTNDKISFCKELGVDVPRLYTIGLSHNNCGGFCVKAGLGQFKLLYQLLPEVYKQNEMEQERIMACNPNLKPFLRKMTRYETRYLTLKQYREEFLEPNTVSEEDSSEFGGCGCAIE